MNTAPPLRGQRRQRLHGRWRAPNHQLAAVRGLLQLMQASQNER